MNAQREPDAHDTTTRAAGGDQGLYERPKVIEFTSPDSATVLYACTLCETVFPRKDRAEVERCCICAVCGKPTDRRHYTECSACSDERYQARRAARRAKAMDKPVVEHDGPVYVDDTERYYESADAAAEALYDDGQDPTLALVHPCSVGTVGVPDLHTYVDESWGEEFEDYDGGLPKEAAEAITACIEVLKPLSPTCWRPMTEKRVQLPRVEVSASARRR